MTTKIEILLPTPDPQAKVTATKLAPRVADLRGKRIGFISNRWRSIDIMYDVFQKQMGEKQEITQFTKKLSNTAGPISGDDFKDLVGKVDVVIVGLGN